MFWTMWVGVAAAVDADGDGWAAGVDCDDTRADVHPGARERCDRVLGIDEDCDGLVDDADPSVGFLPAWHEDLDGDNQPGAFVVRACVGPPGTVRWYRRTLDCDDTDPAVFNELAIWYPDADGDGVAAGSGWVQACHPPAPAGWLPWSGQSDCNDADPRVFPGAFDVCEDGIDQDCAQGDAVCQWWDNTLTGTASHAGFGETIRVVDDATGDGIPDLWVTAPVSNEAWLMAGPLDRDQTQAEAWLTLTSPDPLDADWMDTVATDGDLDGDGLADIAIGVPGVRVGFTDGAGAVYIVRGGGSGTSRVDVAARTVLNGTSSGHLGSSVAIGDWDGGAPEVFASASSLSTPLTHAGVVWVTTPAARGTFSFDAVAEARIEGAVADDHLGQDLLLVEDTDADGFDDLAASGARGTTYLFRHAPSGTVLATDADVSLAARVMAVADLDGDGANELFLTVGEELWVVDGDTDGVDLTVTSARVTTDGSADRAVTVDVGDANGDGVPDLAVGFEESITKDDNGVWLFAGPVQGTHDAALADVVFQGPHDDDAANRVAFADLDGDGVDDLVVGSPRWFYREPLVDGLVYTVMGPLF